MSAKFWKSVLVTFLRLISMCGKKTSLSLEEVVNIVVTSKLLVAMLLTKSQTGHWLFGAHFSVKLLLWMQEKQVILVVIFHAMLHLKVYSGNLNWIVNTFPVMLHLDKLFGWYIWWDGFPGLKQLLIAAALFHIHKQNVEHYSCSQR